MDLVKELAKKLDTLSQQDIGPSGQVLLGDCKRLCLQISGDSNPLLPPPLKILPVASNVAPAGSVLVIDDDEDTLRVLKFFLKRHGFAVECLSEPSAIFSRSPATTPDVILLDLMMPGMTGFELLPQLKKHPVYGASRVMIISSRSFERDRLMALKLGASDFLPKPFEIDELMLRVRNLARSVVAQVS